MTESQRILQVIGREAMQNLCGEFGGANIYVPKHVPDPYRNERIVKMFEDTLNKPGTTCMSSYQKCAEEFELSVSRVRQIANG